MYINNIVFPHKMVSFIKHFFEIFLIDNSIYLLIGYNNFSFQALTR